MDSIITFIAERWPFVAIILIAVVITVLVCRWYYRHFVPTEEKTNDHEKRINDLPCAKHNEEISSIRSYLLAKYPKAFGEFAQKNSPRELNEEGKRLFADIDGMAFLENNGTKLMTYIEQQKPKTQLDVEQLSLGVLYRYLNDDMFNAIKKWVYFSPTRKLMIDGQEKDYVVTLGDVCFVLSIPLRDLYLEFHPY